jgi:hypothetical protein
VPLAVHDALGEPFAAPQGAIDYSLDPAPNECAYIVQALPDKHDVRIVHGHQRLISVRSLCHGPPDLIAVTSHPSAW